MLEDMKVVVVIGNLYRDSYGTKYMITVPFLVNQIAWLIVNHVVKTSDKRNCVKICGYFAYGISFMA